MKIPPFKFTKGEMEEAVRQAVSIQEQEHPPEEMKLALSCIDLTTLNATDTITHVSRFIDKLNCFKTEFPGLPEVAAACVYPNMVPVVREKLEPGNVRVASVAGGFPSSMTFAEIKIMEARYAADRGADEIDIVIPLWAFLDGNFSVCSEEIRNIKDAIGKARLKVILETGILGDPASIWKASILALSAGADFIKTSTGKISPAATPEAAFVMCHALRWWFGETGRQSGIKAAGGIVSTKDALIYTGLVKSILGEEWLCSRLFRIGASRLANNLLSSVLKKEINYF